MTLYNSVLVNFLMLNLIYFGPSVPKHAIGITYQFNPNVEMGASSGPIDDTANWVRTTTPGCEKGNFLYGIAIQNKTGEPMPSLQIVTSQIKRAYEKNGNNFSHGEVVDIFSNNIKIAEVLVYLRHKH